MYTYSVNFLLPLQLDKKPIGDINVKAQLHYYKDLDYKSWDLYDLELCDNIKAIDFANWNYLSKAGIEGFLNDVIESYIEEGKEYLQSEQENDRREQDAMAETYRSLQSQFL